MIVLSIIALVISVVTLGLVVFLELRKQKQIDKLDKYAHRIDDTATKNSMHIFENKQRIDSSFEREKNTLMAVGKLKNAVIELTTKKTTKKKKEETTNVPVQNDQENDSGK